MACDEIGENLGYFCLFMSFSCSTQAQEHAVEICFGEKYNIGLTPNYWRIQLTGMGGTFVGALLFTLGQNLKYKGGIVIEHYNEDLGVGWWEYNLQDKRAYDFAQMPCEKWTTECLVAGLYLGNGFVRLCWCIEVQ